MKSWGQRCHASVPSSLAKRIVYILQTTDTREATSTPAAVFAPSSHNTQPSSVAGTGPPSSSTEQSSIEMSIRQPDRSHDPDLTSRRRSADPASDASRARTITLDPGAERRVFFFTEKGVFLPMNEGLARRVIQSYPNRCDCSFFDELKVSYRAERGWLRRWFGLYTFSHCDFHKASLDF